MANLNFTVTSEGEIALAAAGTAKTILQLVAPANQRLDCRSVSIGFDGVNPSAEPITVELLRQTTAGTMTAATPVKDSAGAESIQSTAQKNATAEPTAGDVLRRWEHHPQAGSFERVFDKREIEIPGGTRLGLRATIPTAGAAVNATAHISAEE
jgi:hypothetical protein